MPISKIGNKGLGAGTVLQVVQAVKTDTFSTTSTSFTDVTGLSATITPSSATNKILVLGYFSLANANTSANYYTRAKLLRNSTDIFIGDAAGTRPQGLAFVAGAQQNVQGHISSAYLDSPATTSAVTYKIQVATESGGTAVVNRAGTDGDTTSYARNAASIVLLEIAA